MCVCVSRKCAHYWGGAVTVCRCMYVCLSVCMYVCNVHVNTVMYVYVPRQYSQFWGGAVTVCRCM